MNSIIFKNNIAELEAQINACSAKIYGLTREELEFVLGIFPIVEPTLKKLTLDEFSLL